MKPMTLLLLMVVMLSSLAMQPSWAADQPEAPAPAGLTAPAVPTLLGPTLLSPVAEPASVKAAAVRVGVIDMERISTESAMGKAAKKAITEQQQKYQKQLDAKKTSLTRCRPISSARCRH
jgi:outer membrane protein